ncbi:hypothetical protein CwatDRAFT_5688 [Crocosphaera watsonii WH 8501]|uniref:Uncharacterized protein n=1 Tax=Crocosphaera watsonii WH 8501 TaxID=165597 RepID=Q4C7K8_CROWT|nr:hypothetical protein CwatDRAFT_5688 [Crocosphaera watsonii WH 8501]
MSSHSELKTSQDVHLRAKQIKSLIRSLKQKIKKIEREGKVAPANCHIIRYQVNGKGTIYWHYNPDSALQKVALNTTSLGLIIKYNCLSS